ncbi:MAG TPA: DUF1206 domain-containing protein [Anaerolineales bacterium]|nr:DUF1206 domain-containing protein [Anaerolineales bacterium]
MSTTNVNKQNPVKKIETEGKAAAKEAAYSPTMEKLTRLGYGIKGLIYITMGLLAIQGALGKGKSPADQLGAIQTFSKLPFAQALLWIVLIGLISYSLWGVIRAIMDPLHKGKDTEGLLARGGYLVSAATYASFVVPTYRLISGGRSGSSGGSQTHLVAQIMSMPMGRILVGVVGVAAIGAGLYQIYLGIRSKFEKQFKTYALSAEQYRLAIQIGRFGTVARGIVFAIVGFFFALAAYTANPGRAQGIDGALSYLAKQPYGLWLMGIVAVGLIAFGIYSLMTAAWFRFKRP